MTEPTLFDPHGDVEAAERAISHANALWVIKALEAGRRLSTACEFLTSEDIHAGVPTHITTHEPRALGGVMRRLQKEGLITPTDTYKASGMRKNHNRPMRVWKSLVFGP